MLFSMIRHVVENDKLLMLKENKSLGNIIMSSWQAKYKMPLYWVLSGVSFVQLRKSGWFNAVLPSKTFENKVMNVLGMGINMSKNVMIEKHC